MADEKPEGYADAPDWQKKAWDSDTNKLMQEAARLLKSGWCTPSEVLYANFDIPPAPEFPSVRVVRGGIKWPRFRVETLIQPEYRAFRRTRWWVNYRYHQWVTDESGKMMHHKVGPFPTREAASNAEQIFRSHMAAINADYEREMRKTSG